MMAPAQQRGVTLIEVLIAMVLMAFGLIGIAALQTTALSSNVISGQYTQASLLAQNLAERMRGNRIGVLNNNYLQAAGAVGNPAVNCATASCTPAQQAQWDLAVWYASAAPGVSLANVPAGPSANLAGAIVSVTCAVTCDANTARIITVYWDGDNNGASGTGCNASSATDLRCLRLPYLP